MTLSLETLALWLVVLLLAVLVAGGAVLLARLRRLAEAQRGQDDTLGPALERLERELRAAVQGSGQSLRSEQADQFARFQQTLLTQQAEAARTGNDQLGAVVQQLHSLQKGVADTLVQQVAALNQGNTQALQSLQQQLGERFEALRLSSEQRQGELRATVEQRLRELQGDNEKKLEQMRQTVDEKLHATLEQRLGESFRQVAERLEQVHSGLGEMRKLAQGVGDLQRVFSNVKSRGMYGEIQLAGLLEQVFTPEQYGANVETVPGSGARVEYAIRLPGDGEGPLWLPIDAKFPREDYERLLQAQEAADKAGAEAAAKALELRLREEARSIRAKYVAAPHTTDFAILFLPTEGLYAEALRRPGLVEALQREQRVMLAGPTTLLALLNSLQMGFRTLALQQRSTEVWKVLGAVKTEFGKFGEALARVRKKLDEAGNTLGAAETRTRAMGRQLKAVEALPVEQARSLLDLPPVNPEDPQAEL
jgi:DNA recombination protein RmuC